MSKMQQLEMFNLPAVEPKKRKGGKRVVKEERPLVSYVEGPILNRNDWPYEYVTDPERLPYIAEDLSKQVILGYDSETLGLDPYLYDVRLVQLTRPGMTYLLDYGRMGTLGPVSDVLSSGPLKVGHLLKFDSKMSQHRLGITPGPLFCTMTAAKILDAGGKKRGFKLGDVSLKYLGIELDKAEQLSDWSGELSEKQLVYAAVDGEIPVKLHPILVKKLLQAGLKDTASLECQLISSVAHLELTGIKVDKEKWRLLAQHNEDERDSLAETLSAIVEEVIPGRGASFNPRSHIQVKEVLKTMGLDVSSTAVESVKRYRKKYPFIKHLLDYREFQTRASTFGMNFLEFIHPVTGRLHPEFDPLGSDTGRYSCYNPNIDNIPKDDRWRSCFIPEEGFVFSVADYSQVELRVAACIARDQAMIDAYQEGLDLHSLTASFLVGCSVDEVTPAQRKLAKSVNFGLIYGMSSDTLRVYAKNSYGVDMTGEEAKTYRNKFFGQYSGLRSWHRNAYKMLDRGVVEVRTIGGRLRRWTDKAPWITHLLNTPVQGSAADGIKAAQVLLHEALKPYGDAAKVVNVIHDEIIVEVREDLAEEVGEIQEDCMKRGMEVYVKDTPVIVEREIGSSWATKP